KGRSRRGSGKKAAAEVKEEVKTVKAETTEENTTPEVKDEANPENNEQAEPSKDYKKQII
ncbi:MAG TPA: hypothetical protein PKN41_11630, partial [Bacteroidales bacterium]|nr:hypothetical protein [Bacteroidales bacterium]